MIHTPEPSQASVSKPPFSPLRHPLREASQDTKEKSLKIMIFVSSWLRGKIIFTSSETSSQYLEESLDIRIETGDKRGTAISLNSLGMVSFDQGNYERAKKYLEESLVINNEIGNKSGIADCIYNFGNIVLSMGDYNLAKSYFLGSLIFKNETSNKNRIAHSLNSLGYMFTIQGVFKLAVKLFSASENILESLGGEYGKNDPIKKR